MFGIISSISSLDTVNDDCPRPRSELDSHANMVVLGCNSYIFDSVPHKTCDMAPFDPKLGTSKKVPIVDGAIAYNCPFKLKTYILIAQNALYLPNIQHNLIPPFIMREAGLQVSEIAKIHTKEPLKSDHCIILDSDQLHISLQLNGIFSFFPSRRPTKEELETCGTIFITPDSASWDSYSTHFAENEKMYTDYDGEINLYANK